MTNGAVCYFRRSERDATLYLYQVQISVGNAHETTQFHHPYLAKSLRSFLSSSLNKRFDARSVL